MHSIIGESLGMGFTGAAFLLRQASRSTAQTPMDAGRYTSHGGATTGRCCEVQTLKKLINQTCLSSDCSSISSNVSQRNANRLPKPLSSQPAKSSILPQNILYITHPIVLVVSIWAAVIPIEPFYCLEIF